MLLSRPKSSWLPFSSCLLFHVLIIFIIGLGFLFILNAIKIVFIFDSVTHLLLVLFEICSEIDGLKGCSVFLIFSEPAPIWLSNVIALQSIVANVSWLSLSLLRLVSVVHTIANHIGHFPDHGQCSSWSSYTMSIKLPISISIACWHRSLSILFGLVTGD